MNSSIPRAMNEVLQKSCQMSLSTST